MKEKQKRDGQTKLGQVTWLGSTAGRIKYPTACGHSHNKRSFRFINYFPSKGNEARRSASDAALHSGRRWGFWASTKTDAPTATGNKAGARDCTKNDRTRKERGSALWQLHCDRLMALSCTALYPDKNKGQWNDVTSSTSYKLTHCSVWSGAACPSFLVSARNNITLRATGRSHWGTLLWRVSVRVKILHNRKVATAVFCTLDC